MSVVSIVLSVAVVVACICRLAPMHIRTHRLEWIAVYLLMLIGAGVAGLDATVRGSTWPELLLLAACCLYLWHSRHTWRPRPPRWMERA